MNSWRVWRRAGDSECWRQRGCVAGTNTADPVTVHDLVTGDGNITCSRAREQNLETALYCEH